MGKKILSGIMLAIMAVLILSVQPSARAPPPSVIKVGWSMPLSFPPAASLVYTAYTHHMYYWMCIDDINNAGGLNVPGVGKLSIEYYVLDDTYSESKMKTNYGTLINVTQCDLLLAPWSSEFNQAIAPTFEKYKYPLIGLTVGSDEIVEKCKSYEWNYTFLVLGQPYEDAEQVKQVISYIHSKVTPDKRMSKAGIAYRADTHGQQHAWALMDILPTLGITVVEEQQYSVIPAPAPDWDTFVSNCKTKGVDLVICCGYDEVAGFINKSITFGFNPKLIFHGPALETPNLVVQLGFNPAIMAGCMYYNGWPATAYKSPALVEWYYKHRIYSKQFWMSIPEPYGPINYPHGYAPFPASAAFYIGVEALFRAVEMVGFPTPGNRALIRDKLEFENIPITLGLGRVVGTAKFNRGAGMTISDHGTITQWQGREMMDVVWPKSAASTDYIIYPKYPWSWADVRTDFNRDGKVDIVDIVFVIGEFGTKYCMYDYLPWYDINSDGKIDIVDIVLTIGDFGKKAPSGGTIPIQ